MMSIKKLDKIKSYSRNKSSLLNGLIGFSTGFKFNISTKQDYVEFEFLKMVLKVLGYTFFEFILLKVYGNTLLYYYGMATL